MTSIANEYSDVEDAINNNNNNNDMTRTKRGLLKPDLVSQKTSNSIGAIFSAAFAFSCIFYLMYSTILLVYFLSGNANGILQQKHAWTGITLLEIVVQDLWLLLLFMTQHSVMAKDSFKNFISYVVPPHLQRCSYVLCTGVAIQLLIFLWTNTLPDANLFLWDYSMCESCRLTCQLLHLFSWIYTIAVTFMLDFSEFIGLKQVYYDGNNFGCPIHAKTQEAQRFLGHFRHATASGLLVIFWVVPCMTLDRLLLASVFTMYLFSTKIDRKDASYVHNMYKKKMQALYMKSS